MSDASMVFPVTALLSSVIASALLLLTNVDYYVNMTSMRKLTREQIADMCARYQAGETTYALAKAFDVSVSAICGLLERRQIERRDPSVAHRKYQCNHGFFTSIDTEEKAYWLGFLAADGTIIHEKGSKGTVNLVLAPQDKEHLYRFQQAIESNHPVGEYHYVSPRSNQVKLRVSSERMVRDLALHGIVQNKTMTVPWPDLPDELLVHFLRGYVDGDGGFHPHRGRQTVSFELTSNHYFIEPCQQFLMRMCDLPKTKWDQRRPPTPIFTLKYAGRLQVGRIARLLYTNATIYLPRKRAKLDTFILHTGVQCSLCTMPILPHQRLHFDAHDKSQITHYLCYSRQCGYRGPRLVKTYQGFISPEGTIYAPVSNLSAFCREQHLGRAKMWLVAQGKKPQYKGWTRYNPS